jgi:KRAB domain-containing zinc finger protein
VELDIRVQGALNLNISGFNKEENGKVKCNKCKYTSIKIGNVRKHCKEVHDMSNTVFMCQECEFQTKRKAHLKAHITAKHQGVRYDCNFCDFQTAYTKALRGHTKTKHNNGESPFKCEQCNFQAGFNKKDLRKHVRETHVSELKEEDEN